MKLGNSLVKINDKNCTLHVQILHDSEVIIKMLGDIDFPMVVSDCKVRKPDTAII